MLFQQLNLLNQKLLSEASLERRVMYLDQKIKYMDQDSELIQKISAHSLEEQLLLKQVIVIGQASGMKKDYLQDLCEQLKPIDQFYQQLGGLLGYQLEILRCLEKKKKTSFLKATFHSPYFHDISSYSPEVEEAIEKGLEALPYTAEFYPLGGAADRLHLVDAQTGSDLPAAKLQFLGRSLFEGLIRDVQAREFLYEQRYQRKIIMPIGIMTSEEKDNHRLIYEMCEASNWFDRPKDSFRLFCQPLVPVVDKEGNWIWLSSGKLFVKPGGHGALWKTAQDQGIFTWLKEKNIKQILVRQVNNPLAGIDSGLLAFLGLGVKHNMAFGFVSCPRLVKMAEGVNVLVEKRKGKWIERSLTNIEYCDFLRYGIEDEPLREGELYSRFTCNTNILFGRLKDLEKVVQNSPYPGLLVNMKEASLQLADGQKEAKVMGRLESTMQNLADVFVEKHLLGSPPKMRRVFVMYNDRKKTISTTKKAYLPGGFFQETPEQGFYDLLQASRELLERYCHFELPKKRSIEETQELGPECAFTYHPMLGPLYSLIAKKLQRGRLLLGSELQLEIALADIQDLELQGSLRILVKKPKEARCILRRVRISNRGVDWKQSLPFWNYALKRLESAQITLEGKSEFIAEDIELIGNHQWVIEDGMRVIVSKKETRKEKIAEVNEMLTSVK